MFENREERDVEKWRVKEREREIGKEKKFHGRKETRVRNWFPCLQTCLTYSEIYQFEI